ncbi:MAG: hypothetical protein A2286_06160 [Gammaproteobacteria bacterium RIFOXYA12_FULL_61_12]|nr:MAG: hypothetical protein A2286_06160 [Gammaproteobacteria bacterium RIFOXYA12_FULL_61_12]
MPRKRVVVMGEGLSQGIIPMKTWAKVPLQSDRDSINLTAFEIQPKPEGRPAFRPAAAPESA